MRKRRKTPARIAWNSACKTCGAICQWFYSVFVLLLLAVTLFAAYVATLDDIPVPSFLIREFQDRLNAKGLMLRMEGIRFQPNGRIIVDDLELYSPDLGSTVIAAEMAVARIKLFPLIFGIVSLDEVSLSSGRFVLPAMLTPSGEPSTAVNSINLKATRRFHRWNIHYANAAIDSLKLSAAGLVDERLLKPPSPKPDAPEFTATRLILNLAPRIAQLQKELNRFESPFCIIDLSVVKNRQIANLELGALHLRLAENLSLQRLLLHGEYTVDSELKVDLQADQAEFPQKTHARSLQLSATWDRLPDALQPYPSRIQASATNIESHGATLPSLVAVAAPFNTYHQAQIQVSLPNTPATLNLRHETQSKSTFLDLDLTLDSDTLVAANPIARKLANADLTALAQLDSAAHLHATATLDASFKPQTVSAFGQSGGATLIGASVDFASAQASLENSQFNLAPIRLVGGKQSGTISLGFNLESLFRRIQIEGSFDPTLINDWFKPWWAAIWDGMVFPEEGMLTYLDSQATFKKPETTRVTGMGKIKNMDFRGMPIEEFETRLYSLYHYVDLYDMRIETATGEHARGEIQFRLGRDVRDEKDKLTGIWIQAISTLDVKLAPTVLWEIADATAKILEPYCYDLPPLVEARSSSVRHLDEYINDIDLQIESAAPFSFHGFPFDSLETFVHIGEDVVDVPYAKATLGGGEAKASAFIVGDGIELDITLDKAGFGEALNAANTYFAAGGSENAQNMDTERLLNYGGFLDASFSGKGMSGDPTSYLGEGNFAISEADFGKFQLFGLLSMALEITPLGFTTLKFTRAESPFTVEKETIRLTNNRIEGPVASIQSSGTYNIETDALNFSARLFPFRNSRVPLISPIINIPLNIVSNVFEVSVTGTFSEPQLRLFNPNTKQEVDVGPNRNPRNSRPSPR